jgi:4-alpha-glucanotransferase
MKIKRSSGALLHISSLPGRFGSGTLGPEAHAFAETLSRTGIEYWQLLPVGPVDGGMGYSPYASSSAFAGNFLFISEERTAEEKWFNLNLHDIEGFDKNIPEQSFILFEDVVKRKKKFLKTASAEFFSHANSVDIAAYEKFCEDEKSWLNDYALFSAIAALKGTNDWSTWDAPLAVRESAALTAVAAENSDSLKYFKFVQFIFFSQWRSLKTKCGELGIKLIGDIPIYVTLEGADGWADSGILLTDPETKMPAAVAGVPPDYFSETGQRWGNPLYNWFSADGLLNEDVYVWWKRRVQHQLRLTDIVRIDHFRGFESFWAIPADEDTAVNGEWIKGPGDLLFDRLTADLGDLPLIAEDLGVITPEVEKLRDDHGLPGMKILQFAFDFNSGNPYLPHNIKDTNCVLYTGTHDNNTTNGWFYEGEVDEGTKKYIAEYLGMEQENDFHIKLMRAAFMSTADLAVVPLQDMLGFGAPYRMNKPGTPSGNWGWKLTSGDIRNGALDKIASMLKIYGRFRQINNSDNSGG